jgi:hypothetical protein
MLPDGRIRAKPVRPSGGRNLHMNTTHLFFFHCLPSSAPLFFSFLVARAERRLVHPVVPHPVVIFFAKLLPAPGAGVQPRFAVHTTHRAGVRGRGITYLIVRPHEFDTETDINYEKVIARHKVQKRTRGRSSVLGRSETRHGRLRPIDSLQMPVHLLLSRKTIHLPGRILQFRESSVCWGR